MNLFKNFLLICIALSMLQIIPVSAAEKSKKNEWWKHAVFYEIYPRSFADGKNKGTGNLKGIIEKLDYLQDLGIDALWITPCYPSPQVDFGYDISDYIDIAPEYGTLKEFDLLVSEAKKRNIKIIMDLVLNHSSDKHKWFIESRSSKDNPKRDWYIWRDAKSPGKNPPNNWVSIFGGSAWQWDDKTDQYYYHFFYKEQPDLNWRNPQVKKAMHDVARFWLDRGVAGFRLDAITTAYESPGLEDNPVKPGKNAYGDLNMENKYNDKLPEIHDLLRDLRKVLEEYDGDRVLIGETFTRDFEGLACMYGKNDDEIQLPMNFFFAFINELSPAKFRKQIEAADKNSRGGWPVYLFSNHDQVRHYDRYGDGNNNDQIAKLTACLLLTLRGTPILYYGEEIGMENNNPKRKEDVLDPIGKVGWPKEIGRDGERTPMQWSGDTNAGFSEVKPWLPVAKNYKTHNVEVESKDPNSILNFYKKAIKIRKENDAIKYGDYTAVDKNNKYMLCYLRRYKDKACLVALNMSDKERPLKFDRQKYKLGKAKTLLASYKNARVTLDCQANLPPFGALIVEFE